MLSKALQDVIAERTRQIEVEGWTLEHDDTHPAGDLADAAGCYALYGSSHANHDISYPPQYWPWEREWWKPSGDQRRNWVKAAALILAEIERHDRNCKPEAQEDT